MKIKGVIEDLEILNKLHKIRKKKTKVKKIIKIYIYEVCFKKIGSFFFAK